MGKGQHDAGARNVRMLFNVGAVGSLTDGQLLDEFTARRDETAELAMAALIERHGPMVLRVCRSVLRDPHEADDAFQATFLVFVRRAGSLWVRDSLGPWLHQVAYRVASCALSASTRRRRHERRAANLTGPAAREEDRDDLGAVLHGEVDRLPSGCREAVILCYFEGLSPEQAARQLGCPVGTVQSRLARGRARLRTRLARRGLTPTQGVPGAPLALPPALVQATIRAALPYLQVSGVVSGAVLKLTQGVLRSMFLFKLKTVAASLITIAALVAGAGAMLQQAPAPQPQPNLDQIRAELGVIPAELAARPNAPNETTPPPPDLEWKDVGLLERQHVIEQLAVQSKGNYDKIKTWQGSYAYFLRQHLEKQFVTQFLAGARPKGDKSAAPGVAEPLIQEFDSIVKFAIDLGADALYRDVQTSRMRYLTVAKEEEIEVPNTAPDDHRSIVTPAAYFYFNPRERATSAFLPDHPEAQMKRRAEHFPASEARMREGGSVDPRAFFRFDPVNSFWTGLELYARVFRGEFGAEQKKVIEQRLKISRAEGPGGTWYRDQMGFDNPGGRMLWVTTLWSPQAGYNPVSIVKSFDTPEGPLQSRVEWQWTVINGIYVPSTIAETTHDPKVGTLTKEQVTKLKECTLNQRLGMHQFDERGLGLADGDLVLDHRERVAFIIKGNEPVKLADFGARSILRPERSKPAVAKPAAKATAQPRPLATGRIFTTASLGTDDAGRPISSVVAVDPDTGDVTKVFDQSPGRLRVAPDGRRAAFVSGEWRTNLPPPERMRKSLWIREFTADASPARVLRLEGTAETGGELPVWSADGKRMIVSVSHHDESRKQWVYETFRVNVDGSDRQPLPIPDQDGVQDWSPDGSWIVTASSRNARIGWQLFVMRLNGKDARQVTEGGNPFCARFAPDGKRLLYSDGPKPDRLGIWIVDVDGKNRRRILPTGRGTASACWSPDGNRMAVAISGSQPDEHGRLEVLELDGTHRTLLTMPGPRIDDMPDWR